MKATWLANVLRLADLEVVEVQGWRDRGEDFDDLRALVWHHDGSGIGDSPGVPSYMTRQIDARKPGAQLWVNRYGVWHVIASGSVFHAGPVMPGKPGNDDSLGIETDATTNEPWPGTLLASLRQGTAALLRQLGEGPTGLEFHKSICRPPGRKTDPWGLSLVEERRCVGRLLTPEDDMPHPKHTTALVACPTGGMWRLEADGGVHSIDGAPFFGSRFTLDEQHQRFERDEWFVGLAPVIVNGKVTGYVLCTNHGDSYRFKG